MDIQQLWQQSDTRDELLDQLLQQRHFEDHASRLPLKKLKNNLLRGITGALLITAGYIGVCFLINGWQVYASMSILILFNLMIIAESWKLYTKTPLTVLPDNSLIEQLSNTCHCFEQWWSLQQKISLFAYPVATVTGFMVGGLLKSGKTIEEFLYSPRMLSILGITLLVIIPVYYYSSKWIFRSQYGKYLQRLQAMIEELKEEKPETREVE